LRNGTGIFVLVFVALGCSVRALVRLALGLIQIVGAFASVLLLLSSGINRLTVLVVVVTGLFTLVGRILFSPRKAPQGK